MDKEEVAAIIEYLTKGVYPDGLSKGDKRSMRKRCTAFVCDDGVLYHRGKSGKRRLVVWDPMEKQKIMATMHQNSNRKSHHNGINITLQKATTWYWWRRMTEDVRAFCKSCVQCGHLGPPDVMNSALEDCEDAETRDLDFVEPLCITPVVVPEQKELSSPSYSSDLLNALHEMYEQKICCDVTLAAGGFQVSTHKLILMATSEYLKSLIADANSSEEVIQLTNIAGLCLEPIISFLYTGTLKLSQENVLLMLSAANQLNIMSAVALCQQFLENSEDDLPATDSSSDEKLMSSDCRPTPTLRSAKSDGSESRNCRVKEEIIVEPEEELNISEAKNCIKEEDVIQVRDEYRNREVSVEPVRRGRPARKARESRSSDSFLKNDFTAESCADRSPVDSSQKRYNTRLSASTKSLPKVPEKIISVSKSKVVPKKEIRDTKRKTIVATLLSAHGKRFSCYMCESSFRFSTGLKLHQCKRHGIARLDLALFRLSRLSVRSAVDFIRRREFRAKSCQNPTTTVSADQDETSDMVVETLPKNSDTSYVVSVAKSNGSGKTVLPAWPNRLFNEWSKLVRLKAPKSQPPVNGQTGAAPSTLFRNRCGWCGKTFLRRAELVEHRQQVHKKPKQLLPPGAAREKRVRRNWNCKEKGCGALLETKALLKDHMAKAHPNVFLSCPHCRYKTQMEHYLKRHLVRRHKERHQCPMCPKSYHKKFLLKVHMYNKHRVEDPSLQLSHCPHEGCGYACPGNAALQIHMQKHTSAKPFTCHICGRDFKRALSLDKHINKIHLGIRPYICDKCGTSCCDEADLKRHLLKHEKNRTYKCTVCQFSTCHKLIFQSHMFCRHQIIINENMPLMRCDQCKFVTNKKYRYNDHMKMHQDIRDIPCPECGKRFVTKKTMRQHIVKVHKQTTQHCRLCSFRTLSVEKLQEHVEVMHDYAKGEQLLTYPGVTASPVKMALSSYPSGGSTSSHPSLPLSYSNADGAPAMGYQGYSGGQAPLLEEQVVRSSLMNCEMTNIQSSIDNGICQFNPYKDDRSGR